LAATPVKKKPRLLQCYKQGDHSSGKPENVREFDSCHGNVRGFTENQGIVREKLLLTKSCLKLYFKLHISVHTGI